MSRIDRVKDEIGWLKLVFGILVASNVSLLGWLAQNYSRVNNSLLAGASLALCLLRGATTWANRIAYQRIKELEDL